MTLEGASSMCSDGARRIILCLAFLCAAAFQAVAGDPVQLRVISYNIHHGEGVDGRLDLPRIANVLLAERPDLVALQEVDDGAARTNSVNQPTELARLMNMQVAFGGNIALQGGQYGNAVLSKFAVRAHRNRPLPNVGAGEQRGLLAVELELPGTAERLLFCSTHFDHRPAATERIQSAARVGELLVDWSGPAVLAGDLNDVRGSEALQILERDWLCTNKTELPTIPVERPLRQIDFVMVRPRQRWKIVETRVLTEATASDHRAILSVIELLSP